MGVKAYLKSEILASSKDEYTDSQISRMLNLINTQVFFFVQDFFELGKGGGLEPDQIWAVHTPLYVIIKQDKKLLDKKFCL